MTKIVDDSGQQAETHFGFASVPWSEKPRRVRGVFDSVATRYDLMNDVMSGGLHRLWKSAFVDMLNPQPGWRVVDVAGGTGDIAMRITDKVRQRGGARSEVIVCAINEPMVRAGTERRATPDYPNIEWTVGDAERLPWADASFDAYTIAFGIRNVRDHKAALAEARRVLKPGGRLMILEFSHVAIPLLDKIYERYSFDVIPRMGQLVAGDRESYQYLVESIRQFPTQEAFARTIAQAGLGRAGYRNLSGGIVAIHSAWRI